MPGAGTLEEVDERSCPRRFGAAELGAWLPTELAASRRYLRETLDRYWDHDWRREHKGADEGPEDHLWRAACAVADMTDALDALT